MERRYPKGVPLLSPEEDMSVDSSAFRKAQRWGASWSSGPCLEWAMLCLGGFTGMGMASVATPVASPCDT